MPKYTENLNLFKYDVPNDGNRPFDIETSLNENWDKIDTFSQENNLQNKITNYITEIPQRIKMEVTKNLAVLKENSIVTIPNGFEEDGTTLHFDYVSITEDVPYVADNYNLQRQLFYRPDTNTLLLIYNTYSGSTAPTTTEDYVIWYDTSNNIIKYRQNRNQNWVTGIGLPVCSIKTENGEFVSNRIFNGFGHMGSLAWVDKDVKIIVTTEKTVNSDGSIDNKEVIMDKCYISTTSNYPNEDLLCYLQDPYPPTGPENGILQWKPERFFVQENEPDVSTSSYGAIWMNPETNKTYYKARNTQIWIEADGCVIVGYFHRKDGIIIENVLPQPKPVKLVKNTDVSWISKLGMPSDHYIDLTLGQTSTYYIAPANGYIMIQKYCTEANQAVSITLRNLKSTSTALICSRIHSTTKNQYVTTTLPVRKGQTFEASYNSNSTTGQYFRFVYAEGDQPCFI